MNLLLDTHAFLWFINGDSELSNHAKTAIEMPQNTSFVSIASLWEIAIKIQIGKLDIFRPFSELERKIQNNGFQVLPISFAQTQIISQLSSHHRDPFDRMLISQAIDQQLTLVSRDTQFKHYGIQTLW
jgi:PIN domain nuclease of toxin-antitoxin system